MKRPLRVGFDLDGVLLYNPVRIARLPIAIFKKLFVKKKDLKFYIPQKKWEKTLWRLAHYSSIFIAPGFEELKKLASERQIEAHIITGRYSMLEDDFKKWLFRMNINHIFKSIHLNRKDEQPHLFKERLIKDLKLDIFVDDNWDIVDHLSKKTKAKIIWVYNILDRFIKYPYKSPGLDRVLKLIKKDIV